jgi:hypothetical protein
MHTKRAKKTRKDTGREEEDKAIRNTKTEKDK